MTKAIAKTDETQETKPAFLQKEVADSNDIEFDISDIKMSELSLAQAISASVDDGDARAGEFVDGVTRANYTNSVDFIVLRHEKSWLKFTDKKLSGRSKDGNFWDDGEKLSEDEKWQSLHQTFFVLVKKDMQPFPMFLSFSKTSAKEGKNLVNLIHRFTTTNNEPIYSRSYTVSSEAQEGKKGKYFIKTISPGSYLSEEEFMFSKEVYNRIKNVNLDKVDRTENETESSDNEEIKID